MALTLDIGVFEILNFRAVREQGIRYINSKIGKGRIKIRE
jgi:hypothetical protein